MKTTIPTDMKYCVNCKNWCGNRQPNAPLLTVVECDSYAKGLCYKSNLQTFWNQNCSKWESQFRG